MQIKINKVSLIKELEKLPYIEILEVGKLDEYIITKKVYGKLNNLWNGFWGTNWLFQILQDKDTKDHYVWIGNTHIKKLEFEQIKELIILIDKNIRS